MGVWGSQEEGGTRVVASEGVWGDPFRWEKGQHGLYHRSSPAFEHHFVFTASIADVFEQWTGPMLDSKGNRWAVVQPTGAWTTVSPRAQDLRESLRWLTMDDCRLRMFDIIRKTTNLTYLLLTKRIADVMATLKRLWVLAEPSSSLAIWLGEWIHGRPPENVWMGTTVENQEWADKRGDELLKVPSVLHWFSYEPALGPVDFTRWIEPRWMCHGCGGVFRRGRSTNPRFGTARCPGCAARGDEPLSHPMPRVKWVIAGGESGHHARPFDLDWARSTIEQCRRHDAAPFIKQLGARPVPHEWWDESHVPHIRRIVRDKAGADPDEWPRNIQVQERPRP